MKVLFLIQNYSIIDGTSMVLYEYIEENEEIDNYKIICRRYKDKQTAINLVSVNSFKELEQEIESGNYCIIHYFKTHGYDLFDWTIKILKKLNMSVPIITTICQKPSYKGLLLSPKEIRLSNVLVFIDKASFYDKLYPFIPIEKKRLNYFGRQQSNIELTKEILSRRSKNAKYIIIGRGSSLNKCPRDIIEIYNKIRIPYKKLVIVGITSNSWLHKLTLNREDIVLIPPVSYNEWLEICNTFDVFWYYIPKTSHSSIDGTLGDAMLLEKPVVYMGSEAPKERFSEGDGCVAESEGEMLNYLEVLGSDDKLRYDIGKKARNRIIDMFSLKTTITNYNHYYREIVRVNTPIYVKIPFSYKLYFIRYSFKAVLRNLISGTFFERFLINYKMLMGKF